MSGENYAMGSPESPAILDPDASNATIMGLLKGFLGAGNNVYYASFSGVAVSAAQDVFEIVAPSTKRVKIRSIVLGQYSDFGDAAAEILSVKIIRGFTTSGSGGSTFTPVNRRSGGAVAGSTVEINNTTVAQDGTGATLISDVFNVAAGWLHNPPPSEQIWMAASERLVVRITAPADALTMSGTVVLEEVT